MKLPAFLALAWACGAGMTLAPLAAAPAPEADSPAPETPAALPSKKPARDEKKDWAMQAYEAKLEAQGAPATETQRDFYRLLAANRNLKSLTVTPSFSNDPAPVPAVVPPVQPFSAAPTVPSPRLAYRGPLIKPLNSRGLSALAEPSRRGTRTPPSLPKPVVAAEARPDHSMLEMPGAVAQFGSGGTIDSLLLGPTAPGNLDLPSVESAAALPLTTDLARLRAAQEAQLAVPGTRRALPVALPVGKPAPAKEWINPPIEKPSIPSPIGQNRIDDPHDRLWMP